MPRKERVNWKIEFPKLLEMGKRGMTLVEIATHYNISRERVRQVYQKHGVDPRDVGVHLRARQSREQTAARLYKKRGNPEQELYLEKKAKFQSKRSNATRVGVPFQMNFSDIEWPTHCPILGLKLDYQSEGRQENSVSFDRIDTTKGYVSGNVVILSWRANRIKNDGSWQEHQLIADFYRNLCTL